MSRVKIFSTARCPICDKTKNLLNKWGVPYIEAKVDSDHAALREMAEITDGARTVPQIVIDGKWIGGFTDLTMLHMDGDLDELIASSSA
jgi:glutaredoxin 3